MFFLAVVLKIPVAALLWIVWWAIRAEVQPDEEHDEDTGGGPHRRIPPRPRRPRRDGPHAPGAKPLPACPPGGRLRVLRPPAPVRAQRVAKSR